MLELAFDVSCDSMEASPPGSPPGTPLFCADNFSVEGNFDGKYI